MVNTGRGRQPRSDHPGPPLVCFILLAAAVAVTAIPACSRTPGARSPLDRDLIIGIALPRGNALLGLSALTNGLRAESLITLAQDGRPEPRLASSWTRSADGLTWTFSLAPNIYFQDGRRATAQVLAPLLQAAAADHGNQATRPNLAEVVSVMAPDSDTIVVRTRAPRVLLLDQLADLTLPSNLADGALGAFVRDREQGDSLSFRAFDKYYRGRPGVEKVTYRSYRSLRAAWAAMMRGETDAIYEVGAAGEFVQAESAVRVYPMVRPFATSVIFNVQRPVLRSPAVRRALSSMIDRNEIVRAAYRGGGTVANGPLWPFHWAIANHHVAGAATERVQRPEAPLRDRPAPKLRFTCLVGPVIMGWEGVALLVQKQLYDQGVDMQLEPLTLEQMMERLRTGDFDAALVEFLGRTPNWIYSFWHSPSSEAPFMFKTGYRAADQQLDRLLASENDDQVRSAIADVYRVMEDDPPAIFIAWPQVGRAISRNFETPLAAGRDVFAPTALWMVRPAGAAK